MPDLKEAFRMLDLFASCGAQSFVVTKTELEWPKDEERGWPANKKHIWGKTYPLETLRVILGPIVRTSAIRRSMKLPDGTQVMTGENVIVRPRSPNIAFIQHDDLKTQEQIDYLRPAAFLIHETSPGNHQAWIAVSGVPVTGKAFTEFARRVRGAAVVNDPSASHATRLAGTQNWKLKYLPDPPTVRILEAHPGRIMTASQLEDLGLLAPPEPLQSAVIDFAPHRVSREPHRERKWPDYHRCLLGAPPASERSGPSRSHADFFWCKMAAQRGWSVEQIAQKLLEVSEKAQERARCRDEGYALITAQNAAAAAERGRQQGRE